MKVRVILLATAVAALAVVVSISVASAGNARTTAQKSTAAIAAPKVPNAAEIKAKYGGQSITFIGDSVGGGHTRDMALATRFSKDTGIKVKVVPHPTASDASYSQLARVFTLASRSSFDVAMIDVVWPGAFAPYLVDLKPKLGAQAKLHAAGIVANDTVDGKLVAMPWFGDFGILYYRTDLLKKYGYTSPPTTWTQLFAMAKKIQDGEQASQPELLRLRLPGQRVRGPDLRRARVDRLVGRRPVHRRRQGHDQQPEGGGDSRPVPQEHRHDHAARRDLLPGGRGAHRVRQPATRPSCATGRMPTRSRPTRSSRRSSGKFSVTDAAARPGRPVRRHRRRLAARGLQVLEAPGRGDRVRPLHDEPGRREVRRDHQHERADDPGGGQGSGGRQGESVPQAADRDRRARHAPGEATWGRTTTRARRTSTRGSARSSTARRRAACCRRSSRSSSGSSSS